MTIRTVAFTSYENSALTDVGQLDAYRAQFPNATHLTLALHLRTTGRISNSIRRGPISEDPNNIVPYVALAKQRGLKVGMLIILFIGKWQWSGNWKPLNPSTALANYYSAVRPWILAAQEAGVEWISLTDEWSQLYKRGANFAAFATLFAAARADFSGQLTSNVNQLDEASFNPAIASLMDFVTISAYVPLAKNNFPTYERMKANLLGTSSVDDVRDLVDTYKLRWNDPTVCGYMTYLRHLAEKVWEKDVVLHTGYKSTVGTAIDPGGDIAETNVDTVTQDRAWQAFIDAAKDPDAGIGARLKGFSCWRWWPKPTDDEMGYSIQGKPAAAAIASRW